MQRLLYISESNIDASDAYSTVTEIVERAQVKNARLEVTGALIFTGQYFAQVLEGSPDNISMLMEYIYNDPRHSNILIADNSPVTIRQFPDWTMAYHGPTPFVTRQITTLLETTSRSGRELAASRLIYLANEFCSQRTPPQKLQ